MRWKNNFPVASKGECVSEGKDVEVGAQ
jgi:hypothetical protein